jgi:HTH-type transcriptional regulator/antitoxin MqsA
MLSCPVCESKRIQNKKILEEFSYGDYSAVIEDFEVFACESCGEYFPTKESQGRAEAVVRDLHRKASNMLSSEEIKRIREFFPLSQDAFGLLLGGGRKAFARYENGRVMQSRPMDNLLRILADYPQAIECLGGSDKHWVSTKAALRYGSPRSGESVPDYGIRMVSWNANKDGCTSEGVF